MKIRLEADYGKIRNTIDFVDQDDACFIAVTHIMNSGSLPEMEYKGQGDVILKTSRVDNIDKFTVIM